jgi:hypothetical protein
MNGEVATARSAAWTVRVRGPLGICESRYREYHPRFDGELTWLEAPGGPDRHLVPLLLELQAFRFEVVDIAWHRT